MLAGGRSQGAAGWLTVALAALTVTGVLPALAASLLTRLLEPVPPWLLLAGACAALLGGAAWLWRAL